MKVRDGDGPGGPVLRQPADEGPEEPDTIPAAGSLPELVDEDEGAPGGLLKDAEGLAEITGEGTLPPAKALLRADAGEDLVRQSDARPLPRRYKAKESDMSPGWYISLPSHVGEVDDDADLLHEDALTRRVWSRQHHDTVQCAAVGHKRVRSEF